MSAFPGPTPPETNPTIQPQDYAPSLFEVTNITLGRQTTVTMAENHNYVIGQLVRLLVPLTYGTYQLNEQTGYVISLPSVTQVLLDIDTALNYNAFISHPSYGPTPPSINAVGDINTGIISSTGSNISSTNIPGSYINIS